MRFLALAALASSPLSVYASPINVNLGTAASFGVLAGSAVTNNGPTVINGNVGILSGSAITGFPPGTVTPPSTEYFADSVASQAEADLSTAYNIAAGALCGTSLTGTDLGGLTLTPGVYCFAASAQLTGTLILNSQDDPDAIFLFQTGSTLTTASNSAVDFINDSGGASVYWQVGTSATLGTGTTFEGNILADASITLGAGTTIQCGSALARSGAVALNSNTVSLETQTCESGSGTSTPEPATAFLLLLVGVPFLLVRRRDRELLSCRRPRAANRQLWS